MLGLSKNDVPLLLPGWLPNDGQSLGWFGGSTIYGCIHTLKQNVFIVIVIMAYHNHQKKHQICIMCEVPPTYDHQKYRRAAYSNEDREYYRGQPSRIAKMRIFVRIATGRPVASWLPHGDE